MSRQLATNRYGGPGEAGRGPLPPAHGGEARPTGRRLAPRARLRAAPRPLPSRALPPADPGQVSRERPRPRWRSRPRAAAAPRQSPRTRPSPLRLTGPRAHSPSDRSASSSGLGARRPMLAGRERLSPSSSFPAASPPPPPPAPAAPESALLRLGRAPAPLSSRAEKSQRWGGRAPLVPLRSRPPLPASSSRPGTGSRAPGPPRRAELAAPTASRKQEGRTAAPARPRLPSGALPATNTNFPKPLPAPGNGGSAGTTRLKGRRRRSPPSSPHLGAPAPPQTFLRPLKVGLGKTRLEIPSIERHSEPPRVPALWSPHVGLRVPQLTPRTVTHSSRTKHPATSR